MTHPKKHAAGIITATASLMENVIASAARRSMQSEAMDCFTAFAMTIVLSI